MPDTQNASIHVCLISAQPIPNLLPLLIEQPGTAIFVVSPEMTVQANRLKKVVAPRGIRVEMRPVPSAYDFEAMVQACTAIDSGAGKADLVLNVTGGTKIAALAAFQVFFFANRRIVYLDTANQQLRDLAPQYRALPVTDNRITVRDCLVSYGMNPLSDGTPAHDAPARPGLDELAALLCHDEALLSRLNTALERQRHGDKTYANITLNELEPRAEVLAASLETCGVARRTGSGNLNVPTKASLFFCQGGWLEEYVYWTVKRLDLKGLDLVMNLKVEWDGTGKGQQATRNEFDVLFTHGNRLHLISCKTSDPERETATGTRATEALNELDALADRAGGLFGQRLLVSARRLRSVDRERAEKMDIRVLEGPELTNLANRMRGWIDGGRP